ncbi:MULTISPECIES: PTS glucose transporter subunit IIA [unclassified Enterococcus]|uniref:PTS sugar transporter subunit IIA n=1 Tax=unclassified Enterococcus TaxID=2608891 RepID=UPI0015566638|nr:PTS glucose transporter subunit IIA [Enterococcus sp. MMGLQ5-2]MBS7585531.1 PTS glucose transporter subunit IIA [Enterococcus sp. MMGLQ5-1]NPD13390.1 PTS glucose transporter subunit IIA [Enterococcus sp. MMGLQ5-1]NPD38061.1 PTS glucose transporter subunit IIA [Enterococcus sp. MMGLQ5-2]
MFEFLNRKEYAIYSPVDGEVVSLGQIPDAVFSQGMMGDGFAVIPENQLVYAPFNGEVKAIFPSKHAISLYTPSGIEYLIHIGLDTVELNGEGFEILVKEGDLFNQNQPLAKVDFDFIASKNKDTMVIVVFPELEKRKPVVELGKHTHGQKIGMLQKK